MACRDLEHPRTTETGPLRGVSFYSPPPTTPHTDVPMAFARATTEVGARAQALTRRVRSVAWLGREGRAVGG